MTKKYIVGSAMGRAKKSDEARNLAVESLAAMALAERAGVAVENEKGKRLYIQNAGMANAISTAVLLVPQMIRSNANCFEVEGVSSMRGKWFRVKPTAAGMELLAAGANIERACSTYPFYRFCPIIRYILRVRRKFGSWLSCFNSCCTEVQAHNLLGLLNDFVKKLRNRLRRVQRAQQAFMRPTRKKFSKMMEEINSLSQIEWVNLLRIDLFLGIGDDQRKLPSVQPSVDEFDRFERLRKEFSRELQDIFGAGFIRAYMVTEYGQDVRVHAHCLIALDAQSHKGAEALVDELGELWEEITEGEGSSTNVHRLKRSLKFSAIGLIRPSDPGAQIGLQKLAAYFTLADAFMRLKVPAKRKAFFVSGPGVSNEWRSQKWQASLPRPKFNEALQQVKFV